MLPLKYLLFECSLKNENILSSPLTQDRKCSHIVVADTAVDGCVVDKLESYLEPKFSLL